MDLDVYLQGAHLSPKVIAPFPFILRETLVMFDAKRFKAAGTRNALGKAE